MAAASAATGSLADINHVVLFMQENRAFDHYFGTMAGVRGFSDPNVQVNDGTPVWYQKVNSSAVHNATYLLPWYLSADGGQYPESTQCMTAGSNSWQANHLALNGGTNDMWAVQNTPYSAGYYKRADLPTHFGLAEAYTVADMYQESVIASTNPNRVTWESGSINCPGGPQSPDEGGPYIDNYSNPGCESPGLNCYPLKWKTFPEYLQDANVTWQTWQDTDNFGDNGLEHFEVFQNAQNGSVLYDRGMAYPGLQAFYDACEQGTLPMVSYIIGPAELSEHPPYQPKDGAWLQDQVASALVNSKSYKDTVLMVSYDETGGWMDHVTPYHSPENTPGEWMQDPYNNEGPVPTGPGFRLPFYMISPWTRGGNVFTSRADHTSQIMFVEKWLAAKGHAVQTQQIPAWRRAHMDDLTSAFDFAHPDFSVPTWPKPATASTDSKGNWNGYALCEAKYAQPRPPVPYGAQSANSSLVSEDGFKTVRGTLTEGRYLVLEMGGKALSAPANASSVAVAPATSKHEGAAQRFVVHETAQASGLFRVASAASKKYVTSSGGLVNGTSGAATFMFGNLGSGKGYSLKDASSGKYWSISSAGKITMGATPAGFGVFSVTYKS